MSVTKKLLPCIAWLGFAGLAWVAALVFAVMESQRPGSAEGLPTLSVLVAIFLSGFGLKIAYGRLGIKGISNALGLLLLIAIGIYLIAEVTVM